MSTGDPVHVVRAHYDAIARRDLAAALDTLAADVDWELLGPPDVPIAGNRRGRDAVAAFFATIRQTVEVTAFAVDRIVAEGDVVVVLGHERFTVKATGRDWNVHWVQVHTVRDGRIARFREYTDTAALRWAYGL